MAAPWTIAHVAVASEPANRSSVGTGFGHGPSDAASSARGSACGWCRPAPGSPASTSSSRWRSRLRLCAAGLAEADARVDPDLVDAGGAAPRAPLGEEGLHLGDHVVVAGVDLHGAGRAPAVHGDPADAELGGHVAAATPRRR